MSFQRKVRSAKCPFGKMSFGEVSFGKVSFGKMSGYPIFRSAKLYAILQARVEKNTHIPRTQSFKAVSLAY
jgi:hypothetical protein